MDSVVKNFPPIQVGEQIIEFPHLVPHVVDLPNHGPDGRTLRVRISYQSHVFSQSCAHDAEDFDFLDEGKNKRTFCIDRFNLSQGLPAICTNLLESNAYTWESKDKNRVSNLAVIDGALVSGRHHVVVYYLFPSKVDGLDVEMVVKSAYEKDINFDHIKRRFRMIQKVKTCFYTKKRIP
ncbi:hypothetical protein SAMN05444279_13514 [Ruegeria intermedia]|uniref:Uncharacterized protein n=1 Tax=Ruegeria intermedia TaxID=996115 RepID=A0A1M5B9S9_9RHOB|nr:hypothetical protein SAMN05444279_13514 [Ruegeria intermedia]